METAIIVMNNSEESSFFFGKYPVMDVCPLLPECHGSEVIFDWSRNF